MPPPEHPDRIHVAFDDYRLVANAGLLLPVALARHLGLVDRHVDLDHAPGQANAGDKMQILPELLLRLHPLPMLLRRLMESAIDTAEFAIAVHIMLATTLALRLVRPTSITSGSAVRIVLPSWLDP